MRIGLPDERATRALGERIGRAAAAGDVIAADGALGAGKTCLAQGVARGLDVPAGHYVNSPTFTILQVHPGRLPFYHVDLYRIADPDEALGLGLDEVIGTDGVALVEWPSRLPDVLTDDALWVHLASGSEGGRVADLRATGPAARRLLAALQALQPDAPAAPA